MTSRDFCYWLQGFFEINGDKISDLSPDQVIMIKKHLSMVFCHEIDPSFGENKNALLGIHNALKGGTNYYAGGLKQDSEYKNSFAGQLMISC